MWAGSRFVVPVDISILVAMTTNHWHLIIWACNSFCSWEVVSHFLIWWISVSMIAAALANSVLIFGCTWHFPQISLALCHGCIRITSCLYYICLMEEDFLQSHHVAYNCPAILLLLSYHKQSVSVWTFQSPPRTLRVNTLHGSVPNQHIPGCEPWRIQRSPIMVDPSQPHPHTESRVSPVPPGILIYHRVNTGLQSTQHNTHLLLCPGRPVFKSLPAIINMIKPLWGAVWRGLWLDMDYGDLCILLSSHPAPATRSPVLLLNKWISAWKYAMHISPQPARPWSVVREAMQTCLTLLIYWEVCLCVRGVQNVNFTSIVNHEPLKGIQ